MHGGLHPDFIDKIQTVYGEQNYKESMNEYNKDLKRILKRNETTKTKEQIYDLSNLPYNNMWNRDYSNTNRPGTAFVGDCINLNKMWDKVQNKLKIEIMVLIIGHTPTPSKIITDRCNNDKFFIVDTSISRCFSRESHDNSPIKITNNLSYLKINIKGTPEFEIFNLKPDSTFYNSDHPPPTTPPPFTPAEPQYTEKLLSDEVKVIEVKDDGCSEGMGCGTKTLLCLAGTCLLVFAVNNIEKLEKKGKKIVKKISKFFDELKEKRGNDEDNSTSVNQQIKEQFQIVSEKGKSKGRAFLKSRFGKSEGNHPYNLFVEQQYQDEQDEPILEELNDSNTQFSIDEETFFEELMPRGNEARSVLEPSKPRPNHRVSTPIPKSTLGSIDYSTSGGGQQGGHNRFVVHKINYKDIKFFIDPSLF
jgi:hypothetical protein